MRIIRKDYEASEKRRKRILIVAACLLAAVIVIVSFFNGRSGPADPAAKGPAASPKAEYGQSRPETDASTDLTALVKKIKHAVVTIETFDDQGRPIGIGSGFVFNERGQVLSNYHVFGNAHRATIKTVAGDFPIKKVVAKNSDSDLILVEAELGSKHIGPLPLSGRPPEVGEKILVMGNPLGLEATVSDGIVSAIRTIPEIGPVIQITSPISPGSSGSPVVNMRGEVIGVASFQLLKGQNLNFAISIDRARELKADGGIDLAALETIDPQLIEGLDPFAKGVTCFQNGFFDEAITYLQEEIGRNPFHAEAYYYLGKSYQETKNTAAVATFKKAIDLKPDYAEALCQLGILYLELNMASEAQNALWQAKEIKPDYFEALLNLGIAYGLKDEYENAVKVLQKATRLQSDSEAFYYLGYSYMKLADHSKAIGALRQAVDLDPESIQAYLALAAAMGAVRNWSAAIKTLNTVIILQPDHAEAHFLLGIMHLGNDDLSSAELEYSILKNLKDAGKYSGELSAAITRFRYQKRQ